MEKKFSGKIWKFGNDIDTDTIIPGKRGTIPDRNEMKKYAFELLKPEFGSTVQPGDILVAGTNFGCGSSREQAATVLYLQWCPLHHRKELCKNLLQKCI